MAGPDHEAWTETTSARERVRMVVETRDAPATVTQIAEEADVAWETANSELDRLLAENQVTQYDEDGQTTYGPNPVQQFIDQILALIREHDRDELEGQLIDHQSRLESLREEHDVGSASELRKTLTDDGLSAAEMQEIRNAAATWEALETERRLVKHALAFYDDVTRLADGDDDHRLPA